MAKVSLRIYNRDIESLIDQNHLDEAIAHCRHILQTFSKHLDTYRLLGKAYLEAKRYDEAVDVFSRILMSVPDDFVAHVGMSIIRDDQAKLDDAIWHMERAFEAQPSNSAIQGELRRLFGRRDGMEPPKIRMTRGALAHMYVQGELYPQAVSEVKAVLAQDANRDDMKSLLARAYFFAGQKADASDICQQLLKRYPYSFDANRIMVELLQGSDSVETTQVYRHRVNELDPYATFTQGSVFHSSEVSDAAVNLERFDYKVQEVEEQVDWSAAGISLGAPAAKAEPEWLKNDYPAPRAEEKPAPAAQAEADIPDFLRQAGWSESSGAAEQPVSFEAESTAESELAPSEMPDWVKAMAPVESEASAPITPTTSADAFDWLSGLSAAASIALPTQEPASSDNIPSWLNNLDDTGAAMSSASSDSSLPDWLKPEAEKTPPPPTPVPAPVPPPVSTPAATIETLGTSAQEQDDAMSWLESLAAKHGAKPEELVTDPNSRTDTPPEWVNQARALGEAQSAASVETPKVEEPAPQATPAPLADETGMWLRNLGQKEAAGEDLFAAEPAKNEFSDSAADVADWLSSLDEAETRAVPVELEPAVSVQDEAVTDSSSLPDWLQGLDTLDKMSAPAVSANDDLPAWLQAEAEPPAQLEPTAPTDWRPVESASEPVYNFEPEPVAEFKFEPTPEPVAEPEFKFEPEIEPEPEAKFEPEFKPVEIDFRPEPARPIPAKPVPPRRTPTRAVKAPVSEPTRPITARNQTGMLTPMVDPALWTAQSEMKRGDIPAALEHFGKLIRKGKWLEEIIRDLRDALYRYPVEVTIWQALGDAYMRANRLQEALDAYTKAEELLR
jgi:tetratricopeptide (TPR) repeat protein